MGQAPTTLALETYARRNTNYLNRMVDSDGLPYFNIFWTNPPEAAHDWPDFGDVMSRQYQAAIMARRMTGEETPIERVWRHKLMSIIDPVTGLLMRPATSFSKHVADMGDQALTLYALITAWADRPDDHLGALIRRAVDTLLRRVQSETDDGGGFLSGFIIKSLMTCARLLDYAPAVELAGLLVRRVFVDQPLFAPDNTFRHGGHMHGNLRTLVGAADYALYTRDPVLFSRVDALYRYACSTATSFGFLPEAVGRTGDIVLCETCALMDYIGLAATLANHGHPEYWGDVERTVRNQLIESQLTDGGWLTAPNRRADTAQFTWRDIGARMVGGYAGWSSPTQILAARETLNAHWGGPELRDKTRAFQNCCGGSGTHAFFIAWKNAARFDDGVLSIHLHFDKSLPQAEVRCSQPFQGRTEIRLHQNCVLRARIPDFADPADLRATVDGQPIAARAWGNYLEMGQRSAGERVVLAYPLAERVEEVAIGNPGGRQYRYRATWKGDTVIDMAPLGDPPATGYSDFDKRDVPIFYGEDGPCRLYQRADWRHEAVPIPSPIHLDTGGLDFWKLPQ
jgi:hypothetical protein